jgi:hypothetical protein
MDSNITGRRRAPPTRSAILELGDQLDELWRRFRAASDAFELADKQRAEFAAANIPAALTQKPGDAGLFHSAFHPGIGLFYLDEAIDRLGEALLRPGCKASDIARDRVQNLLDSREAWRKRLKDFESSVGLGEISRAYDEAFNDLFGALNRLRDMPATTLDELRVKARQWNELAGAGHNARAWNIEAERPDDDDCMMGSILSDLIGNIGPSGPGSAEKPSTAAPVAEAAEALQ